MLLDPQLKNRSRFALSQTQGRLLAEPAVTPMIWQHDLLHADGTPYDAGEIELLRKLGR